MNLYALLSEGSTSCPNCNYMESAPTNKEAIKCRGCNVSLEASVKFCPECGTPVQEQNVQARPIQRSVMGTVLGGPLTGPQMNTKFCTLRPIAWTGEDINYNPITYSGKRIVLNRSNTDANNNSITSREQAVLTCEDGEWYIENTSELRTTFLRVNGRVKLTSGDIIVLGNREFEFKG